MALRRLSVPAALAALLWPADAGATTIVEFAQSVQRTVYKPLVYVIVSFALLLFLWGVFRYIAQAGDEKHAAEGSKLMTYGILVLFVLTCVWGLVHMGLAFLGVEQTTSGSSSVFGISTKSYDSGLDYAPAGSSKYDYNAKSYSF